MRPGSGSRWKSWQILRSRRLSSSRLSAPARPRSWRRAYAISSPRTPAPPCWSGRPTTTSRTGRKPGWTTPSTTLPRPPRCYRGTGTKSGRWKSSFRRCPSSSPARIYPASSPSPCAGSFVTRHGNTAPACSTKHAAGCMTDGTGSSSSSRRPDRRATSWTKHGSTPTAGSSRFPARSARRSSRGNGATSSIPRTRRSTR